MLFVAAILGFLVVVGVWEYQIHCRNLRRVPIRVHVNGTRGKSSVTRLIAAGLRAGEIATCAKTTGSRPRMILPDGSEYAIQRQGRANVLEQLRAIAVAARHEARAAVLECMALNPALQDLSERKMIKSTVGVVTNARSDHLDVMGPGVSDVALALAGTTPRNGPLVTAEDKPDLLRIFDKATKRNDVDLVVTTPDNMSVDENVMRKFSYVEHPENVALSLKVCEILGVEREKALEGMYTATPDLGALRIVHLAFYAKEIDFINAFAANDPDSTLVIWNRVLDLFPDERKRVVILNCRADRAQRSVQLGSILPALAELDRVLLTGTGTRMALEACLKKGMDNNKIIEMENQATGEIFERAVAQIQKAGTVFGMGNIGSGGGDLVEYFENRAVHPDSRSIEV